MNEFNIPAYISTLEVSADDGILDDACKLFDVAQHMLDDAYLCRAFCWGIATSMENQLNYLGSNLLPNMEKRLNIIVDRGILSESDLGSFKFANEEKLHVNSDQTKEDQVAEQEARIDQINSKMMSAAVMLVHAVRTHDQLSEDLGQMKYSEIKAKAAAKRMQPKASIERVA